MSLPAKRILERRKSKSGVVRRLVRCLGIASLALPLLVVTACHDMHRKDDKPQLRMAEVQTLKGQLVGWLRGSSHVELRELADGVERAQVIIEPGRVRVGDWIFDPGSPSLTRFMPPGQQNGFDFIYHLRRTGPGWDLGRLEIRAVRGSTE
jgi:hypothetical protein